MRALLFSVAMLFACALAYGQDDQKAQISETVLIKPKPGHANELEAGIKKHNDKYHAANGTNPAMLRYISYGNYGGWYVWVMQGDGYGSLDSRSTDSDHQADWSKNVDPHVMDYGNTTIWSLNSDYSTGLDQMSNASKYRAWLITLKNGQGYRLRPLMEKMKAAQEKQGNAFVVYDNVINMKGYGDFAILWPFSNYSEWDETGEGIADTYEELHGEGSWVTFLDEWRAIVEDMDEEVREKI